MYYLEDKHSEYEYTCYIRVADALPYINIWKGTSMEDVWNFIREIEKKHSRYNENYYIDNDFYVNPYRRSDYSHYYRFMVRKVNDWKRLSLKNEKCNLRKVA